VIFGVGLCCELSARLDALCLFVCLFVTVTVNCINYTGGRLTSYGLVEAGIE